jgi:hypothetical protein
LCLSQSLGLGLGLGLELGLGLGLEVILLSKINLCSTEPNTASASFPSGFPVRLVMIPSAWSCW